MSSCKDLIAKAVELETEINALTIQVQNKNHRMARALEHASDNLAHQVIEWLITAQKQANK